MGLVVLLCRGTSGEVTLDSQSASALAALGVTSGALVRGENAVGLLLEGWAFDPARAGEAAAAVGARSAEILTGLAQVAVSADTTGTELAQLTTSAARTRGGRE